MFALAKRFADEMIAHAREGAPLEVCGLLVGPPGGPVAQLYRTTNHLHSPVAYEVDPVELLRILRASDERGWPDPLGIYHSHPGGPAYPSAVDLARATMTDGIPLYPHTLYFIVSLQDPERPDLRAFRIRDRRVIEEKLEIISATF